MPPRSTADVLAALDLIQAGLDALRASLADPEPPSTARLVSIKEAANVLGVHERTLRRRKKGPGWVKAGGVWRVDVEALRQG